MRQFLQGQKAAFSIKKYLEGKAIVPRMEREDEEIFDLPLPEEEKEIKRNPRILPKLLDLKRRISSFDECVVATVQNRQLRRRVGA